MRGIADLFIPLENNVSAFQKVQIDYRTHAETASEIAAVLPGPGPATAMAK